MNRQHHRITRTTWPTRPLSDWLIGIAVTGFWLYLAAVFLVNVTSLP